MNKQKFFSSLLVGFGIAGTVPLCTAATGTGATISHNTPKFVATTKSTGKVDPAATIEVSVWLKPHNKSEMDALAKDLYDRESKNYRHWLSKSEFVSRFGPTEAEAKTVQTFFTSNGLKIVKTGPDNAYVRARGTVGQVNSAFRTELKNYLVNGKTIRANATDPYVSGEAASHVASIAGLSSLEYSHPYVSRASMPKAPGGGNSAAALTGPKVAAVAKDTSLPFNSACFGPKERETLTTEGALPKATYTGDTYTSNPELCGYTPQNIYTAYGLEALYKEGYDGKGQTVVILDWCGSPSITADANAFSQQFGLPALTSANFNIIPTGTSYCSAPDPEINIDVEWAHAIAPGAGIDLVVPPTASFQDVDQGLFYAVNEQLGSVISGSYGSEELYTDPTVLATEDLISETAAILGISANFSTGDDGDFTFDFPQYDPPSVSAPADSPYATGVGGVSLALNSNGSIAWQSGWGTNIGLLAEDGPIDPPNELNGFDFGAGGGPSGFFAKPSYQSKLPGAGRQLPDISWLADPYTGAYIALSEEGAVPTIQYTVYGGTSLACPMFSALWAIANQEAGVPLGQAAPYLYSMPSKTIKDILPVYSQNNVYGTVVDAAGATAYSTADLAQPLEGTTTFKSVLWDVPLNPGVVEILTFGTDSGLATAKGWDNVTGVGVPNPKAFADYFKP